MKLFIYKLLQLLALKMSYNKLKKIKNFFVILLKFVFSNIINELYGYKCSDRFGEPPILFFKTKE